MRKNTPLKMGRTKNIIRSVLFMAQLLALAGCILTKGHFSKDGSTFTWKKSPSGRYNSHPDLMKSEADAWVSTVKDISSLRKMKIDVFSRKWDDYEVNDTGVFINKGNLFDGKEQVKYKSAATMGKQLGIPDSLLIRLISEFDRLGLNRFYREEKYFAFETEVYLGYSTGYFYFIDPIPLIQQGDTLNLKEMPNAGNFRDALFDRFVVRRKIDDQWVDWKAVK